MKITTPTLLAENEAPRRPCQVERGMTIYLNSNTRTDTLTAARTQFLSDRYGIKGAVARVSADLFWGEIPR